MPLFGRRADPQKEANQYLDQIPGIGRQYYDPFIQRGGRAGDILEQQYGSLISDPGALLDKIMGGYETSKGYQRQKDILGREIGSSAAAGGIAGTPLHQEQQGEMVEGLLSQDMQNYLKNALGLYQTGLSGESGLYDKGFTASGSMADLMGNLMGTKAGMAYQSAQDKNARRNALISSLMGLGGQLGGALLGGGLGGLGGGYAMPMSGTPYTPWQNPG